MAHTATEIAEWMISYISQKKTVYQTSLVNVIREEFGTDWVYKNKNSNPAIDRTILSEFRRLHDETIKWDTGTLKWTYRVPKEE